MQTSFTLLSVCYVLQNPMRPVHPTAFRCTTCVSLSPGTTAHPTTLPMPQRLLATPALWPGWGWMPAPASCSAVALHGGHQTLRCAHALSGTCTSVAGLGVDAQNMDMIGVDACTRILLSSSIPWWTPNTAMRMLNQDRHQARQPGSGPEPGSAFSSLRTTFCLPRLHVRSCLIGTCSAVRSLVLLLLAVLLECVPQRFAHDCCAAGECASMCGSCVLCRSDTRVSAQVSRVATGCITVDRSL